MFRTIRKLANLAILISGLAFISHYFAPAMQTVDQMQQTVKTIGRG